MDGTNLIGQLLDYGLSGLLLALALSALWYKDRQVTEARRQLTKLEERRTQELVDINIKFARLVAETENVLGPLIKVMERLERRLDV